MSKLLGKCGGKLKEIKGGLGIVGRKVVEGVIFVIG